MSKRAERDKEMIKNIKEQVREHYTEEEWATLMAINNEATQRVFEGFINGIEPDEGLICLDCCRFIPTGRMFENYDYFENCPYCGSSLKESIELRRQQKEAEAEAKKNEASKPFWIFW